MKAYLVAALLSALLLTFMLVQMNTVAEEIVDE
jgi:hypothetical protein